MLDVQLTQDGDLILGQQAVDSNGYLLYYYQKNDHGDIGMTNDPDLGLVPVRDMKMIYGAEGDAQLIHTRLKTELGNWVLYPEIGSDLTDLLGELNTEETARRGISSIYRTLTFDNAFNTNELEVDAIPISHSTILFHVKLIRNNTIVTYAATLDFELNSYNEYDISIQYLNNESEG